MKKEVIKDFKRLVENGVLGSDFETLNELEDILSNLFIEKLDKSSDAQEAYDDLDFELERNLSKYFVYSLGSEPWRVTANKLTDDEFEKYASEWQDYYSASDLNDIEDLCSRIEHRVMKDMSNVGCDCKTALSMICDDVFADEHPFYIEIGESNPRISFLN